MNYLTVDNVSKSYGDNILFENINMYINKGEKVALIARNGMGKSSLLKILSGIEKPEGVNPKVKFHPSIHVSFLDQDPQFNPQDTIWDTIMKLDKKEIQILSAYQESLKQDNSDTEAQDILFKMDEFKVWDTEAEVMEILSKLNLHESEALVKELSGGQKKRLALALILIDNPDFFILDEPTNHLDLSMIEWLQSYLARPGVTLLFITHDRYFLENICDVIYELHNGQIYKYTGNYSDYLEKKSIREENERKSHDKNVKLMEREKEWVNRMPKARGTKNKARIQNFRELKKEVYNYETDDELLIRWQPQRLGSKIIELHYINKKLGDTTIVNDFHYKFRKGDRLGIIGPNGAGKTSLINLITKNIQPDSGKVVHGKTIKFGYYRQENMHLNPDKTVIDTVRDIAEVIPLEKGRKLTAKQLCEHFLFFDNKQRVLVSKLSGGEKRRLYLLTILMENPNILILDEPTNDLDIMTLNVLEEFLLTFKGLIIIVSHDRYFMDKIVDHLFVMEGNGYVRDFPGNYTQYREARQKGILPPPPSHILEEEAVKKEKSPEKKEEKITYEQRKELNRLETKLGKLEDKKKALLSEFENSAGENHEVLMEKQEKLNDLNADIEELELLWLEKVDEYSD